MANSQVSLVGNITADPVLRTTHSGDAVANFTVAVSEGTKDNPQTGFYDVSVWKHLAHNVADSLKKGNRVIVTGTLRTSVWQTKEGENRTKVQVTADNVGAELRFASVHVTPNTRPSVAPAQQQYASDTDWAGQQPPTAEGIREAAGSYNGEPF